MATEKRLDPLEEIERDIKRAWIAAVVAGSATLLFVLFSISGVMKTEGIGAGQFVDVVILLGLALGLRRRSRVCSILLLSYAILNEIDAVASGLRPSLFAPVTLLHLLFIYYWFGGMRAIFAYHKRLSGTAISAGPGNTQSALFSLPLRHPPESLSDETRGVDKKYVSPALASSKGSFVETAPAREMLFVDVAGTENGPFSLSQIKALISVGTIPVDTQCRREGSPDWFPVKTLL